mgnify:CR=1 FL=1
MSERRIAVNVAQGITPERLRPVQSILKRAVDVALENENIEQASISVTLLSDREIAGMNKQYLNHAGPTDVISFPLFEQGEAPVGDIYIGYEQAEKQAADLLIPFETELARLAIHGTLHVLGYDHPDEGAREGTEMWQRQEAILAQVVPSQQ